MGPDFLFASFIFTFIFEIGGTTCHKRSCHGDVGNLAIGRTVTVSSSCGDNAIDSRSCEFQDGDCSLRRCSSCSSGAPNGSHPASHMLDSPFSKSRTYWQSDRLTTAEDKVTIQFDLETTFYFTHLIMVFKTPRPGAMSIERSLDFGKSWEVYQLYAKDCGKTFGIKSREVNPLAKCTTGYSSEEPCSGGEVIYRVLNPVDPIHDPYSAESRHLLKVTNIRIQMWMPQICSKCNLSSNQEVYFRYFAVHDLIIRGTCFCNGHADSCIAFDEKEFDPHESRRAVVHGKCECQHNTKGDHCEQCMPLYNDAPWRPGNGYTGQANPCKRCDCNGHAESCHFDPDSWQFTGQTSGGVCNECRHNTTGRRCERCKDHYFRRADSDLTDPDVCQECNCHPNGTLSSASTEVDVRNSTFITAPCDSTSGQCFCKFGVVGRRCDRCLKGFWDLGKHGCRQCHCDSGICDQVSGECLRNYYDGDDDEEYFAPVRYTSSAAHTLRYLDENEFGSRPMLPQIDQDIKMAASSRRHGSCRCKEKGMRDLEKFCSKNYDYAIKVRVLGAEDDGTTAVVSVLVRRIIKQGLLKISKGKMFLYPESWTMLGCTCPALFPPSDYIVVGHEDVDNGRLIVNTDSFVKRWSHRKNWARIINKILRSRCTWRPV